MKGGKLNGEKNNVIALCTGTNCLSDHYVCLQCTNKINLTKNPPFYQLPVTLYFFTYLVLNRNSKFLQICLFRIFHTGTAIPYMLFSEQHNDFLRIISVVACICISYFCMSPVLFHYVEIGHSRSSFSL